MKVDAGRGKLYDAHQVIRNQWNNVADTWGDQVRAEFEETIWKPLDQLTAEQLRSIDRLERILVECRRACTGNQ